MIRRPGSTCRSQRDLLLAFVDRREVNPGTWTALAHLDGCEECRSDLTDVALTINALRRIGRDTATAEVPVDAWGTLVERVARPAPAPWRWRLSLGSLVSSTLLVAVLVAPFAMPRGDAAEEASTFRRPPAQSLAERRIEQRYIWASRNPPVTPGVARPGEADRGQSRSDIPTDRHEPLEKEDSRSNLGGLAPRAS